MTWKDKMVLDVLVKLRTHVKALLIDEHNDIRSSNLEGAYDAFSIAIGLLRCPFGMLIKQHNSTVNGKSE